jgi:hypothetical protein
MADRCPASGEGPEQDGSCWSCNAEFADEDLVGGVMPEHAVDESPPVTPPPPAPPPPPGARSVLDWRDLKGTSRHVFAGAVARHKWQVSPQVEPTAITEASYDAIVRSVEFDRL